MLEVGVYSTRPYDHESLQRLGEAKPIHWHFREFDLCEGSARTASGMNAVCVFVNDKIDSACIGALHSLGVLHIALRSTGFNNLDVEAAHRTGITVTRVPTYSPHSVAEHTVALLLTLERKIHRAYNRVREQNFSLNGLVGFDLHGKTAGLVGTGRIGRIVGEILRGFGMRILAYDPAPAPEWAKQYAVEYVPLAELMTHSDVISLHLPLTPQTHHIINANTIAQMKRGAYLINVSRGKLVSTGPLIGALKSGHLGGVALDVYEEEEGVFFADLSGEPLQDDLLSRLLTFPNVLITAHQAFLTREALSDIAAITVENLCRLERGEPFIEGTQL